MFHTRERRTTTVACARTVTLASAPVTVPLSVWAHRSRTTACSMHTFGPTHNIKKQSIVSSAPRGYFRPVSMEQPAFERLKELRRLKRLKRLTTVVETTTMKTKCDSAARKVVAKGVCALVEAGHPRAAKVVPMDRGASPSLYLAHAACRAVGVTAPSH